MCGIVGVLNKGLDHSVDRSLLEKMTKIIDHRGPDGFGTYYNSSIDLGRFLDILTDQTFKERAIIEPASIKSIMIEHTKSICDHSELLLGINKFGTMAPSIY